MKEPLIIPHKEFGSLISPTQLWKPYFWVPQGGYQILNYEIAK